MRWTETIVQNDGDEAEFERARPPPPSTRKCNSRRVEAAGQRHCCPVGYSSSALFAAALAQPTDEPADHERGQQERDPHAHADEHIGENYSGAALDGHDARMRVASMPQYGQSSGSPRGFMHLVVFLVFIM